MSRPRCRSTGASPEPTWPTCWGDSTRNSSSPKPHDIHPRTFKKEHLALAAYAVVVGVKAVWVSSLDGEVGLADVGAIQIRRRRRDTEVRIGRVAVARRRPGRGRH